MSICFISRMSFLRELVSAQLRATGYTGRLETLDFQSLHTKTFDHPPSVLFVATNAKKAKIETVAKFCAAHPMTSVGVLAMDDHDEDFIAWAGVGISGYMEPETSIEEIAATILRLAAGEIVCPARLSGLLLSQFARRSNPVTVRAGLNELTHREQQVVELLAEGLSNKHIARRLNITDATVKNHVHSILEKLDVCSRGGAAACYRRSQNGALPTLDMGANAADHSNDRFTRFRGRALKAA